MPYERRGKCIYNKKTGKSKGCSSSIEKAKAHMKALYAATANENEEDEETTFDEFASYMLKKLYSEYKKQH